MPPPPPVTPKDLALQVIGSLRNNGFAAYLVGGCVRDVLLGIVPKDWDVATDATPAQMIPLFPGASRVGAHFGVLMVAVGSVHVEVATFRSDFEYRDGRRPEGVRFERSPREDALRRDFTINGLFLDPSTNEILDFVNGREDLANKTLRAIGDPQRRFEEDHLRLLRAIRFAARLGFLIEPATWRSIGELAPKIGGVAAERARDELTRVLIEGGARRGFEMLDRSGLLPYLLPEIAAMKGVPQPPEYHPEGDVWTHTLLVLEKLEQATPTLAWAGLLHDVGKPPTFQVSDRIRFNGHAEVGAQMARAILVRLRFSSEQTKEIESLVAGHMTFKDAQAMRGSTLKRFVRQDNFEEHLELHRIDCLSSNGNLDTYDFVRTKTAEFEEHDLKPPPLVTGGDLIDLGYAPGPLFSRILSAVEDAQLEGSLFDREQALSFVLSRFPILETRL